MVATATSLYLDNYFSYGKFCMKHYDSMHGVWHRYQTQRIRHEGGSNARSATIPSSVSYNVAGRGGTK